MNSRRKISNLNILKLLLFVSFVTVSSGCASLGTYNTATERRELIFVSTPEEITMGEGIHRDLQREFEILTSGDRVQRVERIGKRLALISDRQDYAYHFYVIKKDEMNAFTTPGGNIYFFSGLLDKLRTDDEVAGVLAHEMGHCAAKHTVKKFQAALGYDLISRILLSRVQSSAAKDVVGLSSSTLMSLIFSAYSRRDELEADRLAVKYTYLAGYDMNGIIETFQVLEREAKGPGMPVFLRSHPLFPDRIETVRTAISEVKEKYGDKL